MDNAFAGDAYLKKASQIELLKDTAEALNDTSDIPSAMEAILSRLAQELGLQTAWVFRYDENYHAFVEVGASGLPPALAWDDEAALKTGWCECQNQFIQGELDRAINLVRCSRLRDAVGDTQGLLFHASIPLRSKEKPLGILNVASSGIDAFTPETLELLMTVGHQVAIAIDRASILFEERMRSKRFRALSELAGVLVGEFDQHRLHQIAIEGFIHKLGYEAAGVTVRADEDQPPRTLVFVIDKKSGRSEYAYDSKSPAPLLPESERLFLSDARSALTQPIGRSNVHVRVESSLAHSFHETDVELLTAFAWLLHAADETIRLHEYAVANAKWAERRQLAADLHDSVSQRLFSASLLAQTAGMLAAKSDEESMSEVARVTARVQKLIVQSQHEMRLWIDALHPDEERTWLEQLGDRIEPLMHQSSPRVTLSIAPQVPKHLPLLVEKALLHVADEALHNALRHAQAKTVRVSVQFILDRLCLTVADDGVGLPARDAQDTHRRYGLVTMTERMQSVDGQLLIQSHADCGTTIVAQICLNFLEAKKV